MRIPTADELGMRLPAGQRSSTAVPNVELGRVDLSGEQELLMREKERLDNEQLARAEIEFNLASLAENSKYDQDDELEMIEDRHAAGLQQALGNASANIMDPNIRAKFVERGIVVNEEAKIRMGLNVFKRKADRERGFMANAFNEIVTNTINMMEGDQGLTAGGQIKQGMTAIQLATDSMVERGIMDNEEAQALMREAQNDMALGKLRTMDPDSQLAALDEEWVKNVPPHVRAMLRAEALEKRDNQTAMNVALELQGMDEVAGQLEIQRRYGDDFDMYDKVRTRFLQLKKDDELGKQALQERAYEEVFPGVFWGDVKIDDIRSELEKMKLDPEQLENLKRAEVAAASGDRQISNPDVVRHLDMLITQDKIVEARTYWSKHFAELSKADFRWYDGRLSPNRNKEPENRALLTPRQVYNSYKKRPEYSGITPEQDDQFWAALQRQTNEYFARHGEAPDNNTVNEWAKQEFREIVLQRAEEREYPFVPNWIENLMGDETEVMAEMDTDTRNRVNAVLFAIQEAGGYSRQEAIDRYNRMPRSRKERIARIAMDNPDLPASQIMGMVMTPTGPPAPPPADNPAPTPGAVP